MDLIKIIRQKNDIQKARILSLFGVDVLEKARSLPEGTIREHGGRKVIKKFGQWVPVKMKERKVTEEPEKTKDKKQEQPDQQKTKQAEENLQKHVKGASDEALKKAIKESKDEKIKEVAQKELDRRKGKESPEEEKVEKKEVDEEKENKFVENFRELSKEQLKFYLNSPDEDIVNAAKKVLKEKGVKKIEEPLIEKFKRLPEQNLRELSNCSDQNLVEIAKRELERRGLKIKETEEDEFYKLFKDYTDENLINSVSLKDKDARNAIWRLIKERGLEDKVNDILKEEKEEKKRQEIRKILLKNKIKGLTDKYKEITNQITDDVIFSKPEKLEKLSREQKEIGRYLQRIKGFENKNKDEDINYVKKKLGIESDEKLKEFFGDGLIISAYINERDGVMVLAEDAYIYRSFYDNEVDMSEFLLNPELEKGSGKGSEIFSNQVKNFKEKEYSKLLTYAARGENYNGYYTWARLGYDFSEEGGKENFKYIVKELSKDKRINEVKSLPELMSFPEGREFWKKNGFAFYGEFDLSDGSENMKVLNKYIQEK